MPTICYYTHVYSRAFDVKDLLLWPNRSGIQLAARVYLRLGSAHACTPHVSSCCMAHGTTEGFSAPIENYCADSPVGKDGYLRGPNVSDKE